MGERAEAGPRAGRVRELDMNAVVGGHDLLLVTLDTLRYDVAARLMAAGRLPNLRRAIPSGRWEKRHSPGSFTYSAHAAILAGFLPTPVTPGPHPRPFAARFPGSETTTSTTWMFDAADLPTGLAKAGYHTICVGGVGFFNKRTPLGSALPGLFAESHWEPGFGVTSPTSFEQQIARAEEAVRRVPGDRPVFLFVNVSALHQPNWFYLEDSSQGDRGGGHEAGRHAAEQAGRADGMAAARGAEAAPDAGRRSAGATVSGDGAGAGPGAGAGAGAAAGGSAGRSPVGQSAGGPGAGARTDTVESHAAALEYVDRHIGRLFALMCGRRPCFAIVCSDHGTAYGEDGHVGHRIGHEVVWTVPYAEFVIEKGEWS